MAPIQRARHILKSFLFDAIRLSMQAGQFARELSQQVQGRKSGTKSVSPEKVRSLYQVVHTLKGTASMIQGAEDVVKSLHELEEHLGTRSMEEAASKPDWVGMAMESIATTHKTLLELRKKNDVNPERKTGEITSPSFQVAKGILVKTTLQSNTQLLWFDLSAVTKILLPEELAGRWAICLHGVWVPVIGENLKNLAYGVGLRMGSHTAVLAVEEVVKLSAWDEASIAGALKGEDLIRSWSSNTTGQHRAA